MKTILLTLEYPPFYGGVAHYYAHLVKYYPEQIIVMDNQNKELLDENRKTLQWLPTINTVKKLLKQEPCHFLIGQILPLGTAVWLLSFWFDFKYTVFLHGTDFNFAMHTGRKKWLATQILNRADKIIAANTYVAEKVKTIIDQKQLGKIKVVNPGIEPQTYKHDELAIKELKDKHDLNNKTILLGIGRLVKRKGFDLVLQGFKLAIQSNPSLVYVIIGQGVEEQNLCQEIKDLGLDNHVIMVGQVNDQEKQLWLQVCDIFILTSRDIHGDVEGFGIVYLEANLAGKPVIAGRSGGVTDAVEDDKNGLLVESENGTAISLAILKLAEYPGLRQRLGDEGRQRTLQKFNWSNQAQKIYNIIHNLKS